MCLARIAFLVSILWAVLGCPGHAIAQNESPPRPAAVEPTTATPLPRLGDLVPRATALGERLSTLKTTLQGVFDMQAAAKSLSEREAKIGALASRIQGLKQSRVYGYDQLADLKAALRDESDALAKTTEALSAAISQVESLQKQWAAERDVWKNLADRVGKEAPAKTVQPTIEEARKTIDRALRLVSDKLNPLIEVQRRAGDLATRLEPLRTELDALLQAVRGELFRKSSPSMFFPRFYSQFGPRLWSDLKQATTRLSWPDASFFLAEGWVIGLQVIVFILVAGGLIRQRQVLESSERWKFLRYRPLAAALFISNAALVSFYGTVPNEWRLLLWSIGGVAASRLTGVLLQRSWRRTLVYLLAGLFLTTEFLRVLGLPLPLFRVYVALVALAGAPLCLWRAEANVKTGSLFYAWVLRLGAVVLFVVLVAEVWGYSPLATHLLESSIKTTFLGLLAWMVTLLARGGVDYLLNRSLIHRLPLVRNNALAIARRVGFLIDFVVGAFVFAMILEVWRLYESPGQAIAGMLALGFSLKEQRITLGLVLAALAVLYTALLASRSIQAILMEEVYPRRRVEFGTRISMNRLIHYGFVVVGVLVALSALGVQLRNLTILAGAFGIGIGFGLQNIVNNFVSGLILLFERPVKVGDVIQMENQWGQIRKLGLRATVVRTLDQAEVIVPNSDFISAQVTNWTLTDRVIRLVLCVGVAYGSDVPLVLRLLREAADECALVLKNPESQVFFMEFGESSLNFELRVWVGDFDSRFRVRSELNQTIDRKFRENDVEIPFPQRDLHLRTVDEPARTAFTRTNPS